MKRLILLMGLVLAVSACAGAMGAETPSDGGDGSVVDDGGDGMGDEPGFEPGNVGEVPNPRLPLDGNADSPVFISGAELLVMESYPIQVALRVSGEKPTPCHEVFWSAGDEGDRIEIEMVSQAPADASCAQVIEPFTISVPLGSWADADRDVYLNGELVGSFQS